MVLPCEVVRALGCFCTVPSSQEGVTLHMAQHGSPPKSHSSEQEGGRVGECAIWKLFAALLFPSLGSYGYT